MAEIGEFVTRAYAANVDSAASGEWLDVSDLTNVTAYIAQRVDNGTVVAQLESTPDMTLVAPEGSTVAESDFAAAVNVAAAPIAVEGANGMPKTVRALRITATTHTGTGEYSLTVTGRKVR